MRSLGLISGAILAVLTFASEARACIVSDGFTGIAFNPAPSQITDDMIVLDVAFDPAQDGEYGSGGADLLTASVRKVVHGHYDGATIRVGIWASSCQRTFIFGAQGVIAGRITTPEQAQATIEPLTITHDGRTFTVPIRWPFRETVFVPVQETVAEHRARTGDDPTK